jgi:ankyrin repeat protein
MLSTIIRTISGGSQDHPHRNHRSHSGSSSSSSSGSNHGRNSGGNFSLFFHSDDEEKINKKFIEVCRDGEILKAKKFYQDVDKDRIKRQALVQCKDSNGVTPLMHAATNGRLDVVKWLVQIVRVNVDDQDIDGTTALMRAAYWGQEAVLQFLVEEGQADCMIRNKRGKCALQIAYTANSKRYLSERMKINDE